jgi:hypothetical protein
MRARSTRNYLQIGCITLPMVDETKPPRAERRWAEKKAKKVAPSTAALRNKKAEHPLREGNNATALAVFGCFTGVGVPMIDSRFGVGVLLCLVGLAGTVWLYWAALGAMRFLEVRTWPKLGLAMIVLQIVIPLYVIVMHVTEAKPAQLTNSDLQTIRSVAQQVTIKPRKENCPKIHITESKFIDNGTAILATGCADINLNSTEMKGNKVGIEGK